MCEHDISEQETAIMDGMCPLCLFDKLNVERKALELACNFANLGKGKYWIGTDATPDYFRQQAKEK